MSRLQRQWRTIHSLRPQKKETEMDLVQIEKYINAIQQILDNRYSNLKNEQTEKEIDDWEVDKDENEHIYWATEDPKPYEDFMKVKFEHWNVYIDQYYAEMHRLTYGESNVHRYAATDLSGQNGWIAFGSLLVAMEANNFVLTLASTWSRLMNELRNKCNRTLIDLLYRLSFYVTFYSLDNFTVFLRRSGRIHDKEQEPTLAPISNLILFDFILRFMSEKYTICLVHVGYE